MASARPPATTPDRGSSTALPPSASGQRFRPRIGIVGELVQRDGGAALRLPLRYAEALARAGGLPQLVAPIPETVPALLEDLDGLFFSGADDFATEPLGLGPTHPQARPVPARKQEFDLALARSALAGDLPVLGVCYGLQLLALADGATLHQHLPDDRPGAREHRGGVVHLVRPRAGTRLTEILGAQPLPVVSRHHQALARLGQRWRISAEDGQGLIEGAERADHPFALGVQWHPELPLPAEAGGERQDARRRHERLFRALVAAAAERRERRSAVA